MRTILGVLFCALIMSMGISMVESTVYSSVDTALNFSQCLIDKMSGSPYFTPDDQNSMIEVKDVLGQALRKTDQRKLSAKILITAFITSLADIIIHDDGSRNAERKQLYLSSLEQCLIWIVGYPDVELLNEAQKILSIIEQNRRMTHEEIRGFISAENPPAGALGSVSYSQINNPFPVQPSPVQNPSASQYFFSNDKTVFDQQQKSQSPPVASSAQVNVNSQYAIQSSSPVDLSSSFSTRMQIQSINPSQTFNIPSVSQTVGSFSSISQNQKPSIISEVSSIPQPEISFRGPYQENFPLNYDTGRIPNTNVSQVGATSYSESQQTGPLNDASQIYNGGLTVPQIKESTVVAIPANTDQQYDSQGIQNQQHRTEIEMPQTLRLENAKPEISPSVANTQAQNQNSDTNSYPTLENIIFNIFMNSRKFREAFNPEISQETAINLARTLTEQAFADYDLNIKNDALYIVTNEVAKVTVPTAENFALALSNALVFVIRRHETSLSTDHSQVANNFLSNLDNPSQVYPQPGTIEKQPQDYYTAETPGQYYTQTENIEKQSQDYYTSETPRELYPLPDIIQNKPQDYSTGEISYPAFVENPRDFDFESPPLSPEDRKDEMFSLSLSEYLSKSDAIRNFFCEGNEPEDIVQISFSIIKASLTDYGLHVPSIAASIASGALSELSKEGLCNNYAKIISEIIAETLEENGIENASAENIANKMELNLIQRQIPPTEPQNLPVRTENFSTGISKTEAYSDVPELESSLTFTEEITPYQQEETETQNPVTSDTQDISDNEYSSPITLQQIFTILFTETPSRNEEDWVTDGAIDQEAFSDYLAKAFDVLESYTSEGTEGDNENTEENTSTIETSLENYEENYIPTTTEGEDKILYLQDTEEIPQKDNSFTYSTDYTTQNTAVELQPSFQEPTPNSELSNAGFQPGTISPSTVFARKVSETAQSSIAYIRSPEFDINNLCSQINQLAPLVNIPVLDYCEPIAAIDYLLNVLQGVVFILNGI